MTIHLSARVAWHMDGWNGRICRNPAANTYCIGAHSYPGMMIAERRDLEWEEENAGRCCSELDTIPPCIYSINAFGSEELTSFSDPPDFFDEGAEQIQWQLPPATVCLWPYEEMYYGEGVRKPGGGYDNDVRLKQAEAYFEDFEEDGSLIFYYANYSNPFSEEDQQRYVVVGLSRLKEVGDVMFYPNCSAETKKRFGGGFVWQRNVTSHYPDQGFRIPYHRYLERPEMLERLVLVPDNPRNFKYATRRLSDDDALNLVERFLEIATFLKDTGDKSEDWSVRIDWLQKLIAELWHGRGLYPGLPKVLDILDFGEAIPYLKAQVAAGKERAAKEAVFAFLDGRAKSVPGLGVAKEAEKRVVRQWRLREEEEQNLLRDVLPKFDLPREQIARALAGDRAKNSLHATLAEIGENPYVLSEQYVGDGPDDVISFSKIDHGMFPSPELGGEPHGPADDAHRLRALCVERLKREDKHTFVPAQQVIHDVNHKLSFLPEWKRHQFTERYLKVDEEELSGALTFREEGGRNYIYLRDVFEAERHIEDQIRFLANGPDIRLRFPVTEKHWHDYLYDSGSPIAQRNPRQYEAAIAGQVEVCQKIFVRPVCVLSGAAGTGKTTVIRALIQAIEKGHGTGTAFQLLAPTGKAADRIREATGKPAATVHSFLAQRGWLNDNMTFKRAGGRQEEGISTYIIDEASMLDLNLTAALFRAVRWTSVQRLIFVGDPSQLPPIGRGRVFADIIDWLEEQRQESVGNLKTNIRQMENRLKGEGTGIIDLASLYIRARQADTKDEGDSVRAEEMLGRVQEGGDVDKDLRVAYWNDPDDLSEKLISTIVADMESDTGETLDEARPFELWGAAFRDKENPRRQRPEYQQVISPYRGEQFGVEYLNLTLQRHVRGRDREPGRHLAGIALFDKVIQVINRPRSNPAYGYNTESGKRERVELFNGELGFVKPHGFDGNKWKWGGFHLTRFQVVFSRKSHFWVEYLGESDVEQNLELAYAISVHKAQGSEFDRVYFVVPKHKKALLSREMFYTGLTRARRHCTLFVEEDVSPLLTLRRPENSHLLGINSSLFTFRPAPDELSRRRDWYEEGKIHRTLADYMVRSKSEVIIANMLFEREIPFKYEVPLYAPDGTFYLPDFTVTWRGEDWYWEHFGLMDDEAYRSHNETKMRWYEKNFPGRLVSTYESGDLSKDADAIIERHFSS